MAEDKGRYFKVTDFMSEIRTKGVLKTNRYEMHFGSDFSPQGAKQISLRCDSIQLPGMNFATVDGFMRFGYGAAESIPYAPVFDQFTATFIVDANSYVHKWLYYWCNMVVNFNSSGQKNLNNNTKFWGGADTWQQRPYEVSYRDNYTTNVTINVYDEATDKWTLSCTAYNAYPRGFPPVDLSYGANDELLKLTIPFGFTDFNVTYNPLEARTAQVAEAEYTTSEELLRQQQNAREFL